MRYESGSDGTTRLAAAKVRRAVPYTPSGLEVEAICAECDRLTVVDAAVFDSCIRALCPRCMKRIGRTTRGR